jgi:2-polyprenyl-3-methyl-5-hydroxy-6-metoxy-1,4-benzoquinol methylase
MSLQALQKVKNIFSSNTVSGGLSYFEYERVVARDILIPWLEKHWLPKELPQENRMSFEQLTIGDFGCHQGGVLQAFREAGALAGKGFDLDTQSILQSPFQTNERFSLHVKDVLSLDPVVYQFDLILIRDVLEHIPNYSQVLKLAKACLKPGGKIFISFPPYYSPFGGHQQEASNWTRFVPFLHYLPASLFFKLVQTANSAYMSQESSLQDMQSVSGTKMTLAKAEQAFKMAGLSIGHASYYSLRPEFTVRYGLPVWQNNFLGTLPLLREMGTMGVYFLLQNETR